MKGRAIIASSFGSNGSGPARLVRVNASGSEHLAADLSLVRSLDRRMLVTVAGALAAAIAAALLVKTTTIAHSHLASGRSLHAVSQFSARWGDFVSRRTSHPERFVFLGWGTPLLALLGLVVVWRARRGLALVLGLGALVPILLALGTHTPLYSPLWHALPPFRYPRVPERLMPVACLAIAALVAFAVARSRRGVLVPALAAALLLVDLHVHVYGASAADERNTAYAALRAAPPGRVLELPVFLPDLHYWSVYQYDDMQALRERPAGYSTVAPKTAYDLMRTLLPMNCGRLDTAQLAELRRLGVRYVAVHRALFRFRRLPKQGPACTPPPARRLHSFPRLASDGEVTIYELP